MNFRCHICGKECGGVLYLMSMREKEIDHPFIGCSERCAEQIDQGHYVKVRIVPVRQAPR